MEHNAIILACCQALGTTPEALASPCRARMAANCRHIAAHEMLRAGISTEQAARLLGRHRTTIYNSARRYAAHFLYWPEFRHQALACRKAVDGFLQAENKAA